jgi:hypothetical protein
MRMVNNSSNTRIDTFLASGHLAPEDILGRMIERLDVACDHVVHETEITEAASHLQLQH